MTRRKMRSTLAEYRPVTLHEVAQPLGAPTAPTGAPAGAGARGPSGAPPSPPCDGCCTRADATALAVTGHKIAVPTVVTAGAREAVRKDAACRVWAAKMRCEKWTGM